MSFLFIDEVQERLAHLSTKDAGDTAHTLPLRSSAPLSNDESYKSKAQNCARNLKISNFDEVTSSILTPPPTPPSLPSVPSFQFIHRTHTCSKIQHSSCYFIIFLIDTITNEQIGQIQARYIDRAALLKLHNSNHSKNSKNKNKKNGNGNERKFHLAKSLQDLNDGDSDGLALAVQVFNPDGTLLPQYPSSSFQGDLGQVAVLILNYLHINKIFRRRGYAKLLLREMIEKARGKRGGVKWVFVKPGVIRDDLKHDFEGLGEEGKKEVEKQALNGTGGFYRGVGFKDVGGKGSGGGWLVLDVDEMFTQGNE